MYGVAFRFVSGAEDRLLLLDTASLYFRAYFGIPDSVKAPDGTPVNAVRGLLDFIARLVADHAPTHLACCWDNDWRPPWRVELLPSYKAHRVVEQRAADVDVEETPDPLADQIPVIVEALTSLGLAIVGVDGYEADDVIGTLATGAGMPVDVVTGDRDLFQLVDDGAQVQVLYTAARGVGRLERITSAVVRDKYGIGPEQYADFATLRGDPSDGLPGVTGIGEKTAAELLRRHGDLAGIRVAAATVGSPLTPAQRRRITEGSTYLDVAPQVVAVARNLDLRAHDLALPADPPVDPAAFAALVKRWGLGGSAVRVVNALRAAADA
ncbi:MAG: 5'-3' exonuclease [Nocardioidaceae bacterium]